MADATPKAATATPMCVSASVWRLVTCRSSLDDELPHHGVVHQAAVLVAGDRVLAGASERHSELTDVAGDGHRVRIGAHDFEAVDHIHAGEPERHRHVRGDFNRVGDERKHPGDDGDYDAT